MKAIVGGVPRTFDRAIRPEGGGDIDVALARRQHEAYVGAVRAAGVEILGVEPDDRYPDCCFVEDPVVVLRDVAVVLPMAAASRRGESTAVAPVLSRERELRSLDPPARIDGGDVLVMDDVVFVGLSSRTNRDGVAALESIARPMGMRVIPVDVRGVLHLKSACTRLAPDAVLACATRLDTGVFSEAGLRVVPVPEGEGYAANCLWLGDTVAVSAGYPGTRQLVAKIAGNVVELGMSEFRKAGGSLTCLSILLE